jgi:hypothetical protein
MRDPNCGFWSTSENTLDCDSKFGHPSLHLVEQPLSGVASALEVMS